MKLALLLGLLAATPIWAVDGFQPPATTATAPTFTLRVLGDPSDPFFHGESFRWRGPAGGATVDLGGTFVSGTAVDVVIPGTLLLTPGTALIYGVESNGNVYGPYPYRINPPPHITLDDNFPEGTIPAASVGRPYQYANTFTGGTAPLTWTVVPGGLPPGLTLSASTGVISGTPTASGRFTFHLRLTDTIGVFHEEDFIIQVLSADALPLSRDDYASTTRGTAVTIAVLANDQAGAGVNPASVVVSAAPVNGAAQPAADGKVTYTPNTGFTGQDTFRYTMADTQGRRSDPAVVYVSVRAIPPPSETGCIVSPQNQRLSKYRPEFYLPAVRKYIQLPQPTLTVNVANNGQPLAGATVRLSASQPAFPAGGSGARLTEAEAATDAKGTAVLNILPNSNGTFDQTDFTARVRIGGSDYQCQGTVVAGINASMEPYVESVPAVVETLALADQIRDQVLAVNKGTGGGDFTRELFALLQEEVVNQPETYQIFREQLRRYEATTQALLEHQVPDFSATLRGDLEDLVRFVYERGGSELRAAAAQVAKNLRLLALLPRSANQDDPLLAANRVRDVLAGRPFSFEQNLGQFHADVDFLGRGPGYSLYLGSTDAVMVRSGTASPDGFHMSLVGATQKTAAEGQAQLPARSNYLIGNDPTAWRQGVPQWARVRYAEVYPGIDVVYYGAERQLEFDFVVSAGADPGKIRMTFPGSESLAVSSEGALQVSEADHAFEFSRPVVYQEVAGIRQEVAGSYVLEGDAVGFQLGSYDHTRPVVIDPVLEYSSFLGGLGPDTPLGMARDAAGNIYVAGTTASANFLLGSPLQPSRRSGGFVVTDVFVTKFDPTGKRVIYSTYLGGGSDDSGSSVAVDADGSVILVGATSSTNFPLRSAYQGTYGNGTDLVGTDGFVAKLNPAGSGLVYSTFLGGSGYDWVSAVAAGAAGSVYLAGRTTSANLPVKAALQPARWGSRTLDQDAVVAKLDSAGSPEFVTYLGGGEYDSIEGIAVFPDGSAAVTGRTGSPDFPLVNPLQSKHGGGADAFIARISGDGRRLVYSTFMGGISDDWATSVAIDSKGNYLVTGATGSPDFPLKNASQSTLGDPRGFDAFALKLATDGASLGFSTFLGGGGFDIGQNVSAGPGDDVYVAGESNSTDFTVKDAFQTKNGGGSDGFVVRLIGTTGALAYSTYIGGSGHDAANALAVDSAGKVYATGSTRSSADAPITLGALQASSGGNADGFLAILTPAVPPPPFVNVSAASGSKQHGLAPESFVTAFGSQLAGETEIGAAPYSTRLGDTEVRVRDSAGVEQVARLHFVSPGQVNWIPPANVAPGLGEVRVVSNGVQTAVETVRFEKVAPGVFQVGSKTAAALVLRVRADGSQTTSPVYDSALEPVPIDLDAAGEQVYLLMFGTGMRNSTQASKVTVGGVSVAMVGPVAQGVFPALDQFNLGPLPRSLAGAGLVKIETTIDGKAANTVMVRVR